MKYSIELREGRYVESHQFLSFTKNIGKNLSSKRSPKLLDQVKKSASDAFQTVSVASKLQIKL